MGGRIKWYSFHCLEYAVILALLFGAGTYLTGKSTGFSFGLENEFARFIVNIIVMSLVFTPIYMWQDAIQERREKSDQEPGFFERLGQRAGRYFRRRARENRN